MFFDNIEENLADLEGKKLTRSDIKDIVVFFFGI